MEGHMDLSGIFGFAREPGNEKIGKQWAMVLAELFGPGNEKVAVTSLLEQIPGIVKLEPLLLQVLLRASVVLGVHLGRCVRQKVVKAKLATSFEWQDGVEAMSGSSLGFKLAQYVQCAREVLHKSDMYCIANDKGSVCRLPLRNAFVAVPSGMAAVCCPVVFRLTRNHIYRLCCTR